MLNYGPQTVVAARPAADLDPHGTCREVQIVMHDDEVFGLVSHERRSRVVHVRRRFEERDVLEAKAHRSGLGLLLGAPGAAVAAGKFVGDQEADIVAGALVGTARVAEAYDDGRLCASGGLLIELPAGTGIRTGAEEAR